jgi:mxaJ protein
MYSRSRELTLVVTVVLCACAWAGCPCSEDAEAPAPASPAPKGVLRVGADPDNLPFSNRRGEGFENKIAELVASELGMKVEYTWRSQLRGFFRETIKSGQCDLMMGVPTHLDMALTTSAYYRSSYVFVYRKDSGLHIRSFDDPALAKVKIGIPILGEANPPPAQALGRRGIVDNVTGFPILGQESGTAPQQKIIQAVIDRKVDVAVVWGPVAGYFAKIQSVPLEIAPVEPQADPGPLPFAFDISIGLKHGNKELREKVQEVLIRKRAEVEKILDEYGVPRLPPGQPRKAGETR